MSILTEEPEDLNSPESLKPFRWRTVGCSLLVLTSAALFVGQFEPQWVPRYETWPGFLRSLLSRIEPFGHGLGVLLVIVTVAVLSRNPGFSTKLLAACAYGSGLSADLIKLLVVRNRPNSLAPDAITTQIHFLFSKSMTWSALAKQATTHDLHSFPSAHTATAFGLAVGLSAIAPSGRWWFLTLATGVGLQRIMTENHFPSDVCTGAAIGLAVGTFAVRRMQSLPGTLMRPDMPDAGSRSAA